MRIKKIQQVLSNFRMLFMHYQQELYWLDSWYLLLSNTYCIGASFNSCAEGICQKNCFLNLFRYKWKRKRVVASIKYIVFKINFYYYIIFIIKKYLFITINKPLIVLFIFVPSYYDMKIRISCIGGTIERFQSIRQNMFSKYSCKANENEKSCCFYC